MTHNNIDYFIKKGILTGSRAFGVEKNDSDYDIAILDETYDDLVQKINPQNILKCMSSGSEFNRMKNTKNIIFKLDDGKKVNLISYRTQTALDMIDRINNEMNEESIALLGDKGERCQKFEELVDKYITLKVLGIPEIAINEDDIPFPQDYCHIDSF